MNASKVRDNIIAFLRRELVGPSPQPEHEPFNGREEILRPQDPPRLRYSAGVLFPSKESVLEADNAAPEELVVADSGPAAGEEPEEVLPGGRSGSDGEAETDREVNRANEFLPSALGLSALVRLPNTLRVTIKCARYEKKAAANLGRPAKDGTWQAHYWRRPVQDVCLIDCRQFVGKGPVVCNPRNWIKTGDDNLKLELHVFSRPFAAADDRDHDRILTFTLINRTQGVSRAKDIHCAFQCEFSVDDPNGSACFLSYPEADLSDKDEEDQANSLLYRDSRTFAVGHGCAATWSGLDGERAGTIGTDVLPMFEVKPILPTAIPNLSLSMREMAREDEWPDTLAKCHRLASEYSAWIDQQEQSLSQLQLAPPQLEAAKRHLAACRTCHDRIVLGIGALASSDAAQAFRWMNSAMLQQQLHYDLGANSRREWDTSTNPLRPVKPYVKPDYEAPVPGKGSWRPFQLAFVLMNLVPIIDPDDPARDVVDLIWFPTGGGKTEAYLGLSAFTILHRRLRNPADGGTTILMRYTLRLLTTQQFQRAASLICACELLRRAHSSKLGTTPITIGLWVGSGVTPNKNADAKKDLRKLHEEGKPNPFVVLTCPWCGVEMGPVKVANSYRTPGYRSESGRVQFQCADGDCAFNATSGLPLIVVDEAIYEDRPTLVIGTVDKFAMMPWVPDAKSLFGGSAAGTSPPDLIIQDELHLISGALGSMVGLYETVVDGLTRRKTEAGVRGAKIVASTATICRAAEQVESLYARSVCLFPPQGLRAGDSFFAQRNDGAIGRAYMGVFGSALSSHVTAQIRVVAALLQAVKCVPNAPARALDPYWTLMTYFNSLRELGHAATLIRADIREYLNALWDRMNVRRPEPGSGKPDLRRFINRDLELTSRIQSSEVTAVLQNLFEPYKEGGAEGRPLNQAVDICLATNMIQVGLDVPRLGLMAVVGQPKTTSEYIQATSRVGRGTDAPGLVVTVYNAAKPRDRSHYEHFRSYHQALYKWVEPTSVTPFAVPVRERALHAQVITLVRYLSDRYSATPKPPPDEELIKQISDLILTRVERADRAEVASTKNMIRDFVTTWRRLQPGLYGTLGPPPDETPLMHRAGTQPSLAWANRSKATPTSMRNVDAGCDADVIALYPQS